VVIPNFESVNLYELFSATTMPVDPTAIAAAPQHRTRSHGVFMMATAEAAAHGLSQEKTKRGQPIRRT